LGQACLGLRKISEALIENFGTSCDSERFSGNPDNWLTEMKVPYGRYSQDALNEWINLARIQ
jgi:hypothetical protein